METLIETLLAFVWLLGLAVFLVTILPLVELLANPVLKHITKYHLIIKGVLVILWLSLSQVLYATTHLVGL